MGTRKEIKLDVIAKEAGVSVVTVSNALNGKKGVSDKLRRKILDIAENLGYETTVKVEKVNSVRRIGVVVAEKFVIEFPSFYMDIYRNIVKVADTKQCLTMLEVVTEIKEQLKEKSTSFINGSVDGIIIIGELDKSYVNWLMSICKVPFVCVDFYNLDKECDYFVVNSFIGAYLLTEKLIELGHSDIGFVGTIRSTNNIMDRYMGYLKALEKNDIEARVDRLYIDRDISGYISKSMMSENIKDDLPTAFVCNCDMTAFTLIELLNERGLSVPDDISVVGFDNYYYKKVKYLELTTYENDSKALASVSVSTLIKRIEKNRKPKGVRLINGKVIDGNTVSQFRS